MIDGDVWRATFTPEGPGTLRIHQPLSESPRYEGFGVGGDWLVEHASHLLGACDEIPNIVPIHESVKSAQKKFGHLRLARSFTPYHELLPAVLAQRVTAVEALRQWAELVHDFGTSAPGPISTLFLPPSPDALAEVPYFRLHRYGIEKKRADTLRQVARHFSWLTTRDFSSLRPNEATQELQRIPGVGIWTAAVAGGLAFGDPDALQVGDFHVKNTAAWALRGTPRGTDAEMAESLTPYAGQRHRVMRWLELDGWRAPARGARQRIVSISRL